MFKALLFVKLPKGYWIFFQHFMSDLFAVFFGLHYVFHYVPWQTFEDFTEHLYL